MGTHRVILACTGHAHFMIITCIIMGTLTAVVSPVTGMHICHDNHMQYGAYLFMLNAVPVRVSGQYLSLIYVS